MEKIEADHSLGLLGYQSVTDKHMKTIEMAPLSWMASMTDSSATTFY